MLPHIKILLSANVASTNNPKKKLPPSGLSLAQSALLRPASIAPPGVAVSDATEPPD